MSAHRRRGASEARGENHQETAGQFTGHRGEEQVSRQHNRLKKPEERPEQGRRANLKRVQPVLLHLLGGKELLLWKFAAQSSKYSFRRSHTGELSLHSAAFIPPWTPTKENAFCHLKVFEE